VNIGQARAYGLLLGLQEIWPKYAEGLKPNHCILATRVAIEVGRYFGVTYEPMAVSIAVFNEAGWKLFQEGVESKDWPADAWSVGTPSDDTLTNGVWNGHLMISGSGVIADLNADQMSRPARNIVVPNWVALRPTEPPPWAHREDGTYIMLKPVPASHYRQARDWRTNYKLMTGDVIRQIKPMIGAN
jgi:hypothetical protein